MNDTSVQSGYVESLIEAKQQLGAKLGSMSIEEEQQWLKECSEKMDQRLSTATPVSWKEIESGAASPTGYENGVVAQIRAVRDKLNRSVPKEVKS